MDKLLGRIGRTMLAVLSATITATALGSEPIAIEKSIFWGDLHTHTAYSMDAYVLNTQTTPEDAYRFAQGESIKHPAGFDIRRNSAKNLCIPTF